MDHVKIFSAMVNVLLSTFALILAKNMGQTTRLRLIRSISGLALTHIAFECFFFVLYYMDVNIWGPSRSPHNLVTISGSTLLTYPLGALITNGLALAVMLLMRVWWLEIAQGLLEEKKQIPVWTWYTFLTAMLTGFLVIAALLPENGSFFQNGYSLFRLFWTVLVILIIGYMLMKAKSIEREMKRRALQWFAYLLLGSVVFFFLMFLTRSTASGQPLPLRFLLESFYPIYTSLILPLWMIIFLRPWLKSISGVKSDSPADCGPHDPGLSEREREILQLILQGCSNQAIADAIYVSEHTVKNAITGLYAKLGVRSRKELLHRFLVEKPEK